MEIRYFNRHTGTIEIEKVYGDSAVKWLYGSNSGKLLGEFLSQVPVSMAYGVYQSSPLSKKKILPFVRDFNIQMQDYLPQDGRDESDPYATFNDFFIRRFRAGKRPFPTEPGLMGAFAEARYFGFESIRDDHTIPVKGKYLSASALLNNEQWAVPFKDGPLLLARLCPVDYHRFHYPDDGDVLDHYRVRGKLHSVNPIALKEMAKIFATNERQVTILDTNNFGKLAYVEVGAIMVGKIVQTHDSKKCSRGEEKGYFLFGGSTVIVIGEQGKWAPSDDIIKYSKEGMETYVHLGSPVAHIKA